MNDPLDALLDEARDHDLHRGHRHPDPARFLERLPSAPARPMTPWRSLAAAIALAVSVGFVLSGTSPREVPASGTAEITAGAVRTGSARIESEVVAWSDDLETRVELGDLDALVVLSELEALDAEHVDGYLEALFDGA